MKQLGFTHESTHNETAEWYTPPAIFDALGLEFDLDPASPGAEAVPWIPAKRHLTILDDGLSQPWAGRVWLNPPYGSKTGEWVSRFIEHGKSGGTGVMLVFARLDTRWFHKNAPYFDAILFVRGRVQFIASTGVIGKGGCGACSMLIAIGDDCVEALRRSGLGFFVDLTDKRAR